MYIDTMSNQAATKLLQSLKLKAQSNTDSLSDQTLIVNLTTMLKNRALVKEWSNTTSTNRPMVSLDTTSTLIGSGDNSSFPTLNK